MKVSCAPGALVGGYSTSILELVGGEVATACLVARCRVTNLSPVTSSVIFRGGSFNEIDPGSCEKPSKRRVLTIMRKIMLVKALADLVYVRVKMSFLFHNFNYYGYGE